MAINERLTALLDMSLMEIRIMYNNMPPGLHKMDTKKRLKILATQIQLAKQNKSVNLYNTKFYESAKQSNKSK